MSEGDTVTNWDLVQSRVGSDPFFVGWVLREYATANQIGYDDLADLLRCNKRALVRLFLCRLPNDNGPDFHSEIRRISEYTQCDADRLVMLIREVIAIKKLGSHSEDNYSSLLLAARDRQKDDEDADHNEKD